MQKKNTFLRPIELMEFDLIQKRFKTPQKLGMFVRMFQDKIDIISFEPGVVINKNHLFNILKTIDKVKK